MRVNTYSEAKDKLPLGPKLALGAWHQGVDVKTYIPSRKTFYRYRKQILEVTGIDVSLPYSLQEPSAKPVLLGMDELLGREVKDVPARIQRSLFGAGI